MTINTLWLLFTWPLLLWVLLYRGYYYTVAIIHVAIMLWLSGWCYYSCGYYAVALRMVLLFMWLLCCGYYDVAIITVAIIHVANMTRFPPYRIYIFYTFPKT